MGLFGGKETEDSSPEWEREWHRAGEVHAAGKHAEAKGIFERLLTDPLLPADKRPLIEENLRRVAQAEAGGIPWEERLDEVQRLIDQGNAAQAHGVMAEIAAMQGLPASQRASMCLNLMLTASMLDDEEGTLQWFDEAARESHRDFAEQVGHILKSIGKHRPERAKMIGEKLAALGER
jgi:hypothetical protein